MLGDLGDILAELKASEPVPGKDSTYLANCRLYPALDIPTGTAFSGADRIPTMQLSLSEYERFWLECRISVHLRSYEALEWSELKEVLEGVLVKLRGLKHGYSNFETNVTSPANEAEACPHPSEGGDIPV